MEPLTAFFLAAGAFFVAHIAGSAWNGVAEERTRQIERMCECIEYLFTEDTIEEEPNEHQ